MKRLFFGMCSVLLLAFAAMPSAAQSSGGKRFNPVGEFSTADEALKAANAIPTTMRGDTQFVCEFGEGRPAAATYTVVQDSRAASMRFIAMPPELTWEAKEGFASLELAAAFANSKEAGFGIRFVSCWDPNRNPASSTITVFYQVPVLRSDITYQALAEKFSTAEEAAEYANRNLSGRARQLAQFVPEFHVGSQVESIWRIVVATGEASGDENAYVWQVAENGEEGESLNVAAACHAANLSGGKEESRIVAVFGTARIASRIALFTFKLATLPQAKLAVPASVFASKSLLDTLGEGRIRQIVRTSADALFTQTQIRLDVNEAVFIAPDVPSSNPADLVAPIPRAANTLLILFTDRMLTDPLRIIDETKMSVVAYYGKGWVVVWHYPPLAHAIPPEKILLHELGHEFGTSDSADVGSVMCSANNTEGCSSTTLVFDKKSLSDIEDGVQAIRQIGLDVYAGLRSSVQPSRVVQPSKVEPSQAPAPIKKPDDGSASSGNKPLKIVFQAIIPGCPEVRYDTLPEEHPLARRANDFAARLGLPLVNIQVGRGITEHCYNTVWADRPADPKQTHGWQKIVEFVRNPMFSATYLGQIQIFIDERFMAFLDERTLVYTVLHEIGHQQPQLRARTFASAKEKELAVDELVLANDSGYSRSDVLANLDTFAHFSLWVQWDSAKLPPELRQYMEDTAHSLALQKQYYQQRWNLP